jgi:CRISPR-associated endonuclease/helicase Cas3
VFEHQISFFDYWGYASPYAHSSHDINYHLLPYSALDRAIVATLALDKNPQICQQLAATIPHDICPQKLKTWIVFFTALSDLGKFDIRYQMQQMEALMAFKRLYHAQHINHNAGLWFNNKQATLSWCHKELPAYLHHDFRSCSLFRQHWLAWLSTMLYGNHQPPTIKKNFFQCDVDYYLLQQDQYARNTWFKALTELLLEPHGLSIKHLPPILNQRTTLLLSGFFNLSDWLSRQTTWFSFQKTPSQTLADYYEQRIQQLKHSSLLEKFNKNKSTNQPIIKHSNTTERTLPLPPKIVEKDTAPKL